MARTRYPSLDRACAKSVFPASRGGLYTDITPETPARGRQAHSKHSFDEARSMMIDDLITKLAVSLDGLLAGVFLGSCMIEHAARKLSAQHWIPYNHAKETVYGPVMPIFFSATLLVSAGVTWHTSSAGQGSATVLLGIAGIITARVNLPLNAEFRRWSFPDHPNGWDVARRRWRNWNLARAVLAVAAFIASLSG